MSGELNNAIESAMQGDRENIGLTHFADYRSGDPAYDYDLAGAALAALADARELGIEAAVAKLDQFMEECRPHAEGTNTST